MIEKWDPGEIQVLVFSLARLMLIVYAYASIVGLLSPNKI